MFLAPSSSPSTNVKSYLPSSGSIQSHRGLPDRVEVRFTIFGQAVSIYARSEEAVLSVSPASARNGLPSTISCVAAPRFSRCGIGAPAGLRAGRNG